MTIDQNEEFEMHELEPEFEEEEKWYTIDLDDTGNFIEERPGFFRIVEIPSEADEVTIISPAARAIGFESKLQAECTTKPMRTTRRSCRSAVSVFKVPPGYYISEQESQARWIVRQGSENNMSVEYGGKIELAPGYTAPTIAKFSVHARSGHSYGERGKSKAELQIRYYKKP